MYRPAISPKLRLTIRPAMLGPDALVLARTREQTRRSTMGATVGTRTQTEIPQTDIAKNQCRQAATEERTPAALRSKGQTRASRPAYQKECRSFRLPGFWDNIESKSLDFAGGE